MSTVCTRAKQVWTGETLFTRTSGTSITIDWNKLTQKQAWTGMNVLVYRAPTRFQGIQKSKHGTTVKTPTVLLNYDFTLEGSTTPCTGMNDNSYAAHDNHGTSYAWNSCFPLALCFDCRGLNAGLFYLQMFGSISKTRNISMSLYVIFSPSKQIRNVLQYYCLTWALNNRTIK